MSAARFEIVHSGAHSFHARFKGVNNEVVWVTESYRTRRAAREAIALIASAISVGGDLGGLTFVAHPLRDLPGVGQELREADPITHTLLGMVTDLTVGLPFENVDERKTA